MVFLHKSASPTVREIHRHDRDPSLINNTCRDLNITQCPYAFTAIVAEPLNVAQPFPLSHDTKFVQGPIFGMSIPSFKLVTDKLYLLVSVSLQLHDPIACLQTFSCNSTEWA